MYRLHQFVCMVKTIHAVVGMNINITAPEGYILIESHKLQLSTMQRNISIWQFFKGQFCTRQCYSKDRHTRTCDGITNLNSLNASLSSDMEMVIFGKPRNRASLCDGWIQQASVLFQNPSVCGHFLRLPSMLFCAHGVHTKIG